MKKVDSLPEVQRLKCVQNGFQYTQTSEIFLYFTEFQDAVISYNFLTNKLLDWFSLFFLDESQFHLDGLLISESYNAAESFIPSATIIWRYHAVFNRQPVYCPLKNRNIFIRIAECLRKSVNLSQKMSPLALFQYFLHRLLDISYDSCQKLSVKAQ